MSRMTLLAVTAAALAIGTLASTTASAGFRPGRPGHFPSAAGAGFIRPHFPSAANFTRPHFPGAANFTRPHFPSAANFIRPHFPVNRFSNVHLHYPHPRYYGGGYAVYQGGGYAPSVVDYTPPAPAYVAPAPAYVAPAPSYTPPAQSSCLSKTYQQDGSVLFTDSCTGEQAAAAPAQTGS
jgi:hypothetical protein